MPSNNFREDEVMKEEINFKTIAGLFGYLKPHMRPWW